MTVPSKARITELLLAWSSGEEEAREELMPLVYDELRRQAARFLRRERSNHTLQATSLVHEVYLKLVDQKRITWQNRAQFFAIASQMMRRILVSHARARNAGKRGGAFQRVTLEPGSAAEPQRDVTLVALDAALTKLEALDPEKGRLVELRFFAGLSIDETADVLGVSPRTIDRQWQTAKAWLHREISCGATA